ncbi:MAG: tetratricopeptide repeat protein [Candidatus Thorarchaeota archaeon]
MKIEEILELYYAGQISEVMEEANKLDDEDKSIGQLIQGICFTMKESYNLGLEIMDSIHEEAKATNNQPLIFIANALLVFALWTWRNVGETMKYIEEAERIVQSNYREQLKGFQNWEGFLFSIKGFNSFLLGQSEVAMTCALQGIEKAEESKIGWLIGFSHYIRSWLHVMSGEIEPAMESFLTTLDIFKHVGNPSWIGVTNWSLGNVLSQVGELEQAFEYAIKSIQDEIETEQWTINLQLSFVLFQELFAKKEDYEGAIAFFEEKKRKYEEMHYHWGVITTANILADYYRSRGDLNRALEIYQNKLSLEETIGHKLDRAWTKTLIGNVYRDKGEFQTAFDQYNDAINLSIKEKRKDIYATVLLHQGLAHLWSGDYQVALENLEECTTYVEQIGNPINMGLAYNITGDIYKAIGDFSSALSYYNKCVNVLEVGGAASHHLAAALVNLGLIHQAQGDHEKAFLFFQRSLKYNQNYNASMQYYRKIDDKLFNSLVTFYIISLKVEMKDLEDAQMYLENLQKLVEVIPNPQVVLRSKFAEGLISKQSPRMSQKAKALELFKEVAEAQTTNFELKVNAMLNLCDLLILEAKSFGEQEVIDELMVLTKNLDGIAEEQHSVTLRIDSLILQSKISLINSNFMDAELFIGKAMDLANSSNVTILKLKIQEEYDHFHENLGNLEKLLAQNLPIIEKMKRLKVESYFSKARKIVLETTSDLNKEEISNVQIK